MADSLLDNRYRYDYIYPRGRSGETLRAVDTYENDRPVVIKRPAPNDAPPIRAGQEASIVNERRALKRLNGHRVLTELLAEGQFFIGGMPHQYIVMERATGMIVADSVLALAREGDRLPRLEMLTILDNLLDLLAAAHEADIIYNDVDAKHLFWSREGYRLKVIDWGNAVFLEGDEVTPQGIGRQTDVYQVGELLYFILTGGGRADVPRDAGTDFAVSFGDDHDNVPPPLQKVVNRALHPNTRLRYPDITSLRRDLTEIRRPLERERDTTVNHVVERLRHDLSKNELRGLANTLDPALGLDPGFPEARRARREIDDRLRDLEVSADLDAVRIYMSGGNWARASDVLNELRDKAGPKTSALVELLLDCSMLMLESDAASTPQAVVEAINMLFDGHIVHAAHTLLTYDTPDDAERKVQWLLAERISSRIPEVLLLRPNIYRLDLALNSLEGGSVNISDAHAALDEVKGMLEGLSNAGTDDLATLRDSFRALVDKLSTLNKLLSTVMVQQRLSNRNLPLSSLDRALNAAMGLADNMHVIGKQAAGSPRDAMVALDNSRSIDPTNPLWDQLAELLNTLYDLLQSCQTYVPSADGSDLAAWFKETREALVPYDDRLFDDMLSGMIDDLDAGAAAWGRYAKCVVQGDRAGAVTALSEAADALQTISPALTGWLNQLRSIVESTSYVQRNAVYGGLGRALADGYEAFDRARLSEAEQLGYRAVEIATSDVEQAAGQRLLDLSRAAREWVERKHVTNREHTQRTLDTVEGLYTEFEQHEQDRFANQMPSRETYLKAMNRGLVDTYQRSSTTALRLYYLQAILLGTLEAHDANLEDAGFWREVAVRALGDYGKRHEATRLLDEFIAQRRAINEAEALLNQINDKSALQTLDSVRRKLNENVESRTLTDALQSIRELEAGLQEWSDGDFRTAGLKLENALNSAREAEAAADISLEAYKGWLEKLSSAAAELHNLARQMRQTIERRPDEPADVVYEAHRRAAEDTHALLGEPYHAQLQTWYDTYRAFLDAYSDTSIRRSGRMERFNELFKAMFIDRHPAYPLYRHWYEILENSPEFPAPPTDEPVPRINENEDESEVTSAIGLDYPEETEALPHEPAVGLRRRGWRRWAVGLVLALIAGGGGYFALQALTADDGGDDPNIIAGVPVTRETPTPASTAEATTTAATDVVSVAAATTETGPSAAVTPETTPEGTAEAAAPTPVVRVSSTPSSSPTPSPSPTATDTPAPTATDTPVPTQTPVPTDTLTPTITPSPTLPPQGLQGWQDVLSLLPRLESPFWDEQAFAPAPGNAGWRLGVSQETPDDELTISLPSDTLNDYYGNNAPSRVRRTEATVAFTTYNPAVIDQEQVYFGLMLESVNDPALKVGLHIQVVNLTTVNLSIRNGNETEFVIQRSVNAIDPRIRLERDAASGEVTVFFDDFQVGDAIPFVAPEAAVRPVLFVKDGGVIVNVTNWRVGLR